MHVRGEWLTLCKRGAYTLLPADAPYISDDVVDRGGDSLVESFVIHLLFVGQVGRNCDGS
jgi:hypothetical protein